MGADGTGTGAVAAPLVWQPALTAAEVRLEIADKAAGAHWAGVGCWCDRPHEAGDLGVSLAAAPWDTEMTGAGA
jgi:hypothetical protein